MAEIWAFVASVDPLLVQAVGDVDRRLLRQSRAMTLPARLRESGEVLAFARRWRRVASA